MYTVEGAYASAIIYSHTAEDYAIAQVRAICDNEASEGCRVRVMPDVHPGKAGPVGLAMTVGGRILPGLIGADIGCGVSYFCIREKKIEYGKLDTVIREHIPAGMKLRKDAHHRSVEFDTGELRCGRHVNGEKARLSLGTLGGGNHFLELDRDEDGSIYVLVHSGSRHLGVEVTEYYLAEGQKFLKAQGVNVPYALTWLDGRLMEDYLHDLGAVQSFASLNREIILSGLAKYMKWKTERAGECIHNYVDENRILRKGAVAAYEGMEVVIPVNMRDGVILGRGKGNPDWNCSAPHGAGRVLKRGDVEKQHTVSEYRAFMKGIYSPTIGKGTLDEAPFAYRGLMEITEAVADTVTVEKVIRPVYNYKAEERR